MILSNAQIKTITSKDDPVLDPFKCFKMRNTGIYFISNPISVLVNFLDKDNITIIDKGLLSIKILNKNINEEETGVIPSLDIFIREMGSSVKVAAPQMNISQTMIPNVTKSTYVQVIYEYTTISNKYYRWSYSINTDPNILDTTTPEIPYIETKSQVVHTRSQQFRSDYYYTKDNKTMYSRKWDNNNDADVIYNKTDMNNQFVSYRDEVLAEWNILKSYPTMYYPDQYNFTGGPRGSTFTTNGTNVNNTHYSIVHPDSHFVNIGNVINCLYLTDGKPEYEYTPVDDKLNISNVYNGINTYRNSFYINPFHNLITFPSIIPFDTRSGNMPGYYEYGGAYYPSGNSPYFILSGRDTVAAYYLTGKTPYFILSGGGTGPGDNGDVYSTDNPTFDLMPSYIQGDMVVTLGHAVKDRVVSIKTHIPRVVNYLSYLTIHNTYGRNGELLTRYKPNAFPTASVIADIKTKLLTQKTIMDTRFFTGIKIGAVQSYTTRTTEYAPYNFLSVMHGCIISYSGDSLTTYTNLVQLEKDKKWINVQST